MSNPLKNQMPQPLNGASGRLIPPAELFARPGEDVTIDAGPPLTPDERFRDRVAAAWAWVKAVRFYDHEHERLRDVLVEIITNEVNDEQK